MERQKGTEVRESGERSEREAERVKHRADRKIRGKVNPDTTLPLMTGVKQCNCTADLSGGVSTEKSPKQHP